MQHLIDIGTGLLASLPPLETASTVLAVLYLLLVIRENIWCWTAGLISVLLSLVVFWNARLYMESGLQVFYAVMSVYGWYQWQFGGPREEGTPIRLWPPRVHGAALGVTAVLTVAFGYYLLRYTNEARPFVDSFTTIGALVATYMVAKKVLENWRYWFVIDAVSAYLYLSRGLFLYAALFAVYLVMIIIGYRAWARQWRAEQAGVSLEAV
ncbi:MAG TPA: nicotinamide riboside transporter PnuC [Gammaproteobacteria bacterium]|nr:nicotinamide riboside transporter PnuC [Gammaproteobacteria bacterium]